MTPRSPSRRPLSEQPTLSRRPRPVSVGRLRRRTMGSLCERRVKALARLLRSAPALRVTRRSRRLLAGYGRPYPSSHRPLAGVDFAGPAG